MRDRLKDWQMATSTPATDAAPSSSGLDLTGINASFINNAKGDAINAVVSLGYKQVQADKAVKAIYQTDMNSEDLIRNALKSML